MYVFLGGNFSPLPIQGLHPFRPLSFFFSSGVKPFDDIDSLAKSVPLSLLCGNSTFPLITGQGRAILRDRAFFSPSSWTTEPEPSGLIPSPLRDVEAFPLCSFSLFSFFQADAFSCLSKRDVGKRVFLRLEGIFFFFLRLLYRGRRVSPQNPPLFQKKETQ